MLRQILIVSVVLLIPLRASAQENRFRECSLNTLPCRSPVTVAGNVDSCIRVNSPELRSMYVTGVFLTKTTFGFTSVLQSSTYSGPRKDSVLVTHAKPLCLCQDYTGFTNEKICNAKKLKPGRYSIAVNMHPIEDIEGNRNFHSSYGIAEFMVDSKGRINEIRP